MFKKILYLFILFISLEIRGQQFQNSDLDGVIVSLSSLPSSWSAVPSGFIFSIATTPGVTDTPDLSDGSGPAGFLGIFGFPYSGSTYLSGSHAKDSVQDIAWQEGIQQEVSGFVVGNTYSINFHQSVDANTNVFDQSGSWAVYADNELIGVSEPSFSSISHLNKNLEWEARSISFVPGKSAYIIRFLPYDDDDDLQVSSSNYSGALRMAIDSIYISKQVIKMPNVFTPNNDGFNDVFVPLEFKEIENASVEIYDRWGQKVFSSSDLNQGWDGKFNSSQCSPGTYYWVVAYDDKYLSGYVMLLE